jgi:hypothetical protein
MTDLRSKTPGGALEYCKYLMDKGYASPSQVNPWKTAIQKVFETVDGDAWEEVDLASIDLDDYFARFQTLAGGKYKAESVVAYTRRVRNAFDAHDHYLTTGRPPSFRASARKKAEPKTQPKVTNSTGSGSQSNGGGETPANTNAAPTPAGMVDLMFPLADGRMAKLTVPPRMSADDVNRLSGLIRNLQDDDLDQKRIPASTGSGQ